MNYLLHYIKIVFLGLGSYQMRSLPAERVSTNSLIVFESALPTDQLGRAIFLTQNNDKNKIRWMNTPFVVKFVAHLISNYNINMTLIFCQYGFEVHRSFKAIGEFWTCLFVYYECFVLIIVGGIWVEANSIEISNSLIMQL